MGEPGPPPSGEDTRQESATSLDVPGGRRARADEWALVLASQGIPCAVATTPLGFVIEVAAADRSRAAAALSAYERENPPEPEGTASKAAVEVTAAGGEPLVAALCVVFALLVIFVVSGERAHGHWMFANGSARAGRILDGEWWRSVTALFLHADLPHVIGNALFGLYAFTQVCRPLGSGLGFAMILAAGAIGNGLNALSQPTTHDSVGASTAVFGAIGLLAGRALARRQQAGVRGARLLVPLGAGLGLLAMLGTSGARVDLWAHLYGLVSGAGLGAVVALALPRPPDARVQRLLGIGSLLFAAFCWSLALR